MNQIERGNRDDPDIDSHSDLDEPMGSQSADAEAPLTHTLSKSNFFASPETEKAGTVTWAGRGSFKTQVWQLVLIKKDEKMLSFYWVFKNAFYSSVVGSKQLSPASLNISF